MKTLRETHFEQKRIVFDPFDIQAIDIHLFREDIGVTTPPSQRYSVIVCLGRKNRPYGGFFICVLIQSISRAVKPEAVLQSALEGKFRSLPFINSIRYTICNTTVTLSAFLGNAQPWRFFYARISRVMGAMHA